MEDLFPVNKSRVVNIDLNCVKSDIFFTLKFLKLKLY